MASSTMSYGNVVAYSSSTWGAASSMPSAASVEGKTVHTVIVGSTDGSLRYDPMNITAKPGDYVDYIFHAKNHTGTTFDPHLAFE
jgi:plastocyanin